MEGYTVEQARKLAGLSIRDMAHKLGLSVNAYTAKEKHQTRFYYDEACRFSEITGIAPERIYFGQTVAE